MIFQTSATPLCHLLEQRTQEAPALGLSPRTPSSPKLMNSCRLKLEQRHPLRSQAGKQPEGVAEAQTLLNGRLCDMPMPPLALISWRSGPASTFRLHFESCAAATWAPPGGHCESFI